MRLNFVIAAAFLVIAAPVTAEIKLLEKGYEVALGDLRLPSVDNGTIAYKECKSCAFVTKQVNSETQWILNGQRVSLQKFRDSVDAVRSGKVRHATVRRHLDSGRITRVSVYIR